MQFFDLVIIGGGMAAMAAAKAYRLSDKVSSVCMVSEQPDIPYRKPPLSKQLWGDMALNEIFYNPSKFQVDFKPNQKVSSVDFDRKKIKLESGETLVYSTLVIATGLRPKVLPGNSSKAIYFNNLKDYRRLKREVQGKNSALIVGGGLLAVELASALPSFISEVKLVIPRSRPLSNFVSDRMGEFVNKRLKAAGVEVISGVRAVRIEDDGVKFNDGSTVDSDLYLPVIGQIPSLGFFSQRTNAADEGLKVDRQLRLKETEDVFACGDVVEFEDIPGSFRYEENALRTGSVAGRNAAGSFEFVEPSGFSYSEFLSSRLESVGYGAAHEMNVADEHWEEETGKGVSVFARDGVIERITLLNHSLNNGASDSLFRKVIGRTPPSTVSALTSRILKNVSE